MNITLQRLPFISIYLDDILEASKCNDEHLLHLCQVFQCLNDDGLIVHPDKCQFGLKSISSLGHLVSHDGIKLLLDKVTVVRHLLIPTTSEHLSNYQLFS